MKLFILLVLTLASKLSVIDALINGTAVTNVLAKPNPYACQIRSINQAQTEKLNSTGLILSKRWVVGIAAMIHTSAGATVFGYFGRIIYNDLALTMYFQNISTSANMTALGPLALLQTEMSLPLNGTLLAAPLPILGQNYGTANATIVGWGPNLATNRWSSLRRFGIFRIEYNSIYKNTTGAILETQMVCSPLDPVGLCAAPNNGDAGSVVWTQFNSTHEAVVGLAIGRYTNTLNACAILAVRLTKYFAILDMYQKYQYP